MMIYYLTLRVKMRSRRSLHVQNNIIQLTRRSSNQIGIGNVQALQRYLLRSLPENQNSLRECLLDNRIIRKCIVQYHRWESLT